MNSRPPVTRRPRRRKALDSLLRLFYRRCEGLSGPYIFSSVFVPQKILRINAFAPWPVHPSSRIAFWKRIKLGRRSYPGLSPVCYIQAVNGIEIGNNVRIAQGVHLISANHDPDDYDRHLPAPPIRIGDNVWLATNVVVLPGVTIGSNVVIGAGSIVTRDIPSNSIAFGIPCRVRRKKGPYKGRFYGPPPEE